MNLFKDICLTKIFKKLSHYNKKYLFLKNYNYEIIKINSIKMNEKI